MKYVDIVIEVSPNLREGIENRMFELGAEGIREEGSKVVACLPHSVWEESRPELQRFIKSLENQFPQEARVSFEVRAVADQNWAESWKEFYQSAPLGQSFYLVPIWLKDEPVPTGKIPIFMEPGQAFGTGLHESTRLCVQLLESATTSGLLRESHTLLDVGTGTGILAVVARHLGVKNLEALDNDPLAVEAAEENFKLNRVSGVKLSCTELGPTGEPYDFIVSNILLNVHLELATIYRERLKPGGGLILAGLLVEQEETIRAALAERGFEVRERVSQGEWLGLLAVRP